MHKLIVDFEKNTDFRTNCRFSAVDRLFFKKTSKLEFLFWFNEWAQHLSIIARNAQQMRDVSSLSELSAKENREFFDTTHHFSITFPN